MLKIESFEEVYDLVIPSSGSEVFSFLFFSYLIEERKTLPIP
jgi:hypothetical protein